MERLYTRWGKVLDANDILQEYPRPLLRRDSYVNLNGYWDYAFTKEFKKPERYDGRILVPFSPETVLSGVERQLKPDEYLWYRRQFDCAMQNAGTRLILHFGAVDQACRVYVWKRGRQACGRISPLFRRHHEVPTLRKASVNAGGNRSKDRSRTVRRLPWSRGD